MKKTDTLMILTALMLTALGSEANVVVNPLFTDHLVLQRDVEIPVWGKADPGEAVTVEYLPHEGCGTSGQKVGTRAAEDGGWRVSLKPLPLSRTGGRLIIAGDKAKGAAPQEFIDVLVGEVWLGSGQSNMAYGTRHFTASAPDLKKACESGPYPALRVYVGNRWQPADSENLRDFSATLFSFGHALHHELEVPVGLMVGAANGTPSGSWLTAEMASASPQLVGMFKQHSGFSSLAEMEADWREKKARFKTEVKNADAKDRKQMRFSHPGSPLGDNYKKHILKLIPYAIRGVLWDQGESGTKIPGVDQYTTMSALIAGWRKAWGMGDFPFLHIQKPSGGGCAWDAEYPAGRKAPLEWAPLPEDPLPEDRSCERHLTHIKMGTIKNAPLVTTSDLTPGVHPQQKYHYGRRACQVALGTVYGRDIVTCGPVYKSHTVRGGEIEVSFDNVGKGLAFRHGDQLQGFEIAGADLKWEWADARIKGGSVIVNSTRVRQPRHVRYAFHRTFNWANLFNKDGLPALIFTTASR